jgi:hypothetical protein
MARSEAATVEEYLAELPEQRRAVVSAVRDLIHRNLPEGYVESMSWGVIAYEVPLSRYPDTYNKRPLMYAGLAAQKNYFALYLSFVYGRPESERRLRSEFEAAGKKLDLGKACLRFRSLDDLVLDAIARLIAETPVDRFIACYEASRKKG